MRRAHGLLGRLDDVSDRLSPLVVKDVRQVVRGREFISSFNATLLVGLNIAFFGAADALTGSATSGRGVFIALMVCLAGLGLAVVPLGAFNALRNERLEQTLDLITLTALSPRRVIVGKLLAQAVKLATLFAAMAPFVAMSFLLGGIDFVTILVSLGVLFLWSVWACAACLFLSTLLKSRAISGFVFGGVAVILFVVFGLGRGLFFMFRSGSAGAPFWTFGATGGRSWWVLAIATSFCLMTIINFVLLAENRLSLPTENKVTPLRVGFLVQFLLVAAWLLEFVNDPLPVRSNAVAALGIIGGLHLAVVAMFTVTEDLALSRRARLTLQRSSAARWLQAAAGPGGGRGALYVLLQMALLLSFAWLFEPPATAYRWLLAICAYICFFTGLPAVVFRALKPRSAAAAKLRVAVLVLFALAMVLPDALYYLLWQPGTLDLSFGARHLLNPFRVLGDWILVETQYGFAMPAFLGLIGVSAYVGLIGIARRVALEEAVPDPQIPGEAAGEPDRANLLY